MAALTVMKKQGMDLRIHESLDELETDLVEYIAQISRPVSRRGTVSLLRCLAVPSSASSENYAYLHLTRFWIGENGISFGLTNAPSLRVMLITTIGLQGRIFSLSYL